MTTFSDLIPMSARAALGRWQVPARTAADVFRGFPSWFTGPDDPVRDALGEGMAAVWTRVASAASRAGVGHLRAHAKGWRLDMVAAAAGTVRGESETDAALRARLATIEDVVSPEAVRTAVAAAYPGAVVVEPWRHGLYLGRGYLGRPPVDHRSTRLAGDGRTRTYPVGAVRLWSGVRARFHVVLPRRRGRAFIGRDLCLTRSVSAARSYLSSNAAQSAQRALALALDRITAAGVRWSASFDALTTTET